MTDDVYKRYKQIRDRAFGILKFAKRQSFSDIEFLVDEEKRLAGDIFERGIAHIPNGVDRNDIDKILLNLVNREKDPTEKLLKQIQREAVIGIDYELDLNTFRILLNSCTDLSLEEDPYDLDDETFFKKYDQEAADRKRKFFNE